MKIIYFTTGFISLLLGIIGVFLPVLPTTPFVLLSSICFAKSSPSFGMWFKKQKLYQKHFKDYEIDQSLKLNIKAKIIITTSFSLSVSSLFIKYLSVKLILAAILLLTAYFFVFKVKTKG